MSVFETPEPIAVTLDLGVADVRIAASDRADTVVDVDPSDPTKKGDVAAARETRVELEGGRLLVKAPRSWRHSSFRGGDQSIRVEIALPAGSLVQGDTAVGALRCTGRLGECRFKTGAGEIRVEEAGALEIRTGVGDVAVDQVGGRADVASGSGRIDVGRVDGSASIRNANGDTWLGEVTGELRVTAANGRIVVDRARATVAAKTANGEIRLGEVVHGGVVAATAFGPVDIGVRDGVAAWLDLHTKFGSVRNDLETAGRPAPGDAAVEIRARTGYGDIAVRRVAADRALAGEER